MTLGLKTVGVAGVRIEAKARGLIAGGEPLLERLRQDAGFFLSDRVIDEARAFCSEV
jgi:predicted nucleic acid-binding protein